MSFQLQSNYKPRGDQGQAIAKLIKSVEAGTRHQTLLGVTGSGKTFTIANVIRELDRPTLVISHNKTLAAQLYSEFKQFFPRNAVEYFVSYFDYYQPEAYIPRSDTYIEKDSSINEEIERLRLSTTSALLSRRDVIVVASVSCIYGITSPEDYERMLLTVKREQHTSREAVLGRLVDMLYERNDMNFSRGRFHVRGDVVGNLQRRVSGVSAARVDVDNHIVSERKRASTAPAGGTGILLSRGGTQCAVRVGDLPDGPLRLALRVGLLAAGPATAGRRHRRRQGGTASTRRTTPRNLMLAFSLGQKAQTTVNQRRAQRISRAYSFALRQRCLCRKCFKRCSFQTQT